MTRILSVQSSARTDDSITRELSAKLIERLSAAHGDATLTEREADSTVPLLDSAWLAANFAEAESRTAEQKEALAYSDALVDEVRDADILVIGAPIYNFTIPGSLKAWLDQVCRAGLTFRYTPDGPVGLLEGKKAYIVVASGGTKVGSAVDFHTDYMRHVMGFIGIHDVTFVAADRLMADRDEAMEAANRSIDSIAA